MGLFDGSYRFRWANHSRSVWFDGNGGGWAGRSQFAGVAQLCRGSFAGGGWYGGRGDGRCREDIFLHEHGGGYTQVVVHAQDAGKDADNQQFGMTALQGGVEDVVFGGEAGHGRETGQGKHEDSQSARQERSAIPEAAKVAVVVAAIIDALQQRDDAERAQVHEAVAEQVEEDGTESDGTAHYDADEQVAGMGDAGIGQHPFEVVLRKGQDVAANDGENRDSPDDRSPIGLGIEEDDIKDAGEGDEGGGLRADRHKGGDWSGCAIVDIGRPCLEGNGGHLEGKTDRE